MNSKKNRKGKRDDFKKKSGVCGKVKPRLKNDETNFHMDNLILGSSSNNWMEGVVGDC